MTNPESPGITPEQLRVFRDRARLGQLTDIEEAKLAIAAIRRDYSAMPAERKEARAKKAPVPTVDHSADF